MVEVSKNSITISAKDNPALIAFELLRTKYYPCLLDQMSTRKIKIMEEGHHSRELIRIRGMQDQINFVRGILETQEMMVLRHSYVDCPEAELQAAVDKIIPKGLPDRFPFSDALMSLVSSR